MNRSREPRPEPSGAVSTIGPGLRVIGNCITDGAIHIDGLVEGSIKAAEVVVEEGGIVQGDIQTHNLIVAGHVSGNIAARGRAEFKASCHVEGDILSPRIKIEEGGRIDGRLRMSAGPSKPNATTLEPPG
jgi:cytoskeletal protein CcmA (bactofilin family)